MSKAETITVPIKVDTTDLETSLQLAKELEATLEKANRLLDQLTSGKKLAKDIMRQGRANNRRRRGLL